ncbi:MAG: prepilin-type N-terminal cleavage/methylation domain-containing protein [Phycisphaera sp.]|nr:prepilin-type N-terminal cleavage/methylation domain-containing protein [Phycisphaera sp.]
MRRGAFTLIEVMAVVVVMGLLACATAWTMAGTARRGNRDLARSRLVFADRLARVAGSRTGQRSTLDIDLDKQTITRTLTDTDGREVDRQTVTLPEGQRVERVLTVEQPDESWVFADDGVVHADESGVVEIVYSRHGRSPSYAVLLSTGDEKQWVVFSGLTGQTDTQTDDKTVKNIFSLLATGRADAD